MKRVKYGEDERNFFELYSPREKNGVAVVVHGGGFTRGSVSSKNTLTLVEFFLSRGYTVANLEYRLCPEVKWPTPLRDIENGVKRVFKYLKDVKGNSIYVGSSAGATAGAILIYSPPDGNGLGKYFDGFIGLSGVYNLKYLPRNFEEEFRRACDVSNNPIEFKDIVSNVPALLIHGKEDPLDSVGGRMNNHAEYLREKLSSKGVKVKVLSVPGGHDAPISSIRNGDSKVINEIERFLRGNSR